MGETVTCKQFLEKLTKDYKEQQRGYELTLTHYVEQHDARELKRQFEGLLIDGAETQAIRYAAFYALTILHRRNKDITLLEILIKTYQEEFEEQHVTYPHLYVLYLKEKGVGKDVQIIIHKAYEAYKKLYDNAGVIHNFVETVVSAYEDSDSTMRHTIQRDWLEHASTAIDEAIQLDNQYAKYYCTRGRLRAIEKKFEQAKEDLRRAIDIEDSDKKDYVIRLGNYQYYLSAIQSSQHLQNMNDEFASHSRLLEKTMQELDDNIKASNIKNLEFLGFFAAIVSFTIGSIQIINNQSLDDAILLIITLFTCLMGVFSAFGIILHGFNKKTWTNTVLFIVSIIGMCVVFYYR